MKIYCIIDITHNSYSENVVLMARGAQVVSDKERVENKTACRNDDLEPMVDAEKTTT